MPIIIMPVFIKLFVFLLFRFIYVFTILVKIHVRFNYINKKLFTQKILKELLEYLNYNIA